MYFILFIGVMLGSWIISSRLKAKFKKYSEYPINYGMSGKGCGRKNA